VLHESKANETVPKFQVPVKYKSKVTNASDYGTNPNENYLKTLLFASSAPFR